MKLETTMNRNSSRAGERGAALITMLLVSVLLLGAGGALIMSTMMSANNAIGSTPEMQAYYVAESGMQSALNVLRGNTQPLVVAADRGRIAGEGRPGAGRQRLRSGADER